MWVGRREFEDFRQESLADRRELHDEVRDAAREIRDLRRDIWLIAKLGGGLLSVLGILAPVAIAVVQLLWPAHH